MVVLGLFEFFFVGVDNTVFLFFFASRRRHTRFDCDWSSDVCSSDLICEPGPDPAAASAASAGILGPQIERTDDTLRALGLRARDLYESLAPTLAENTGIDIGLWRDGIASLAFDESEAERLRDVVAHQRQAGLRCDWLEAEEVAERFPATAPCLGAMFAPEDGAVDAPALARALHADAKRHGARTLNARVTRLTTILGRATGVEIPAGKIKAEHVIIAAGAWSTRIDHLPRTLPVQTSVAKWRLRRGRPTC